jgi:outer membrane lipoprotein-sorting protein
MPFRWTVTWLDGREAFELSEIQLNAPVDPARFTKPSPPLKGAPR